jgi:TonB family protein
MKPRSALHFNVKFHMGRCQISIVVIGLCMQACSTNASVAWDAFDQYQAQATGNPCARLKRVIFNPPNYPIEARRHRQEGWVVAAFDVSREGVSKNIRVVESAPLGVFEDAAITSLRNSRFAATDTTHTGCVMPIQFRLQ